LSELDKLVSDLEGGKLALEDSLAAFERGMQVSKQAAAILDAAEARIEQLTASGDVKPLDLGQG
jgi:exodeoxyribonuclease VII small subunit